MGPLCIKMNWRTKAALQNLVGKMPSDVSYAVYYFLQRRVGGLRSTTPMTRLVAGIETARRICERGRTLEGKVFLEVGTGRQINIPLSLWLCGAAETITVDLNPYLKSELVARDILYLRSHEGEVRNLFKELRQDGMAQDRLTRLISASNRLEELLSLANIRYLAPADARALDLGSGSVDYHISYTVLEHIPPAALKSIFREGQRLLKPDGLFVHCIDFSDHFAHSDPGISYVNFLQFSEREWERLAGNRYMYHNRLRVDDFLALIRSLGLEIQSVDTEVDERSLEVLRKGFMLDERFSTKDYQTNATKSAWVVASPGGKAAQGSCA
jgi:SAM-dependent methyltransferase